MQNKHCKRFFISGKVQGVWFRASTKEQAQRLGITGWARNMDDGRVEVLACGSSESLDQLHAWLQAGPSRAKVTEVKSEDMPWQDCQGFEVC